MSDFLNRLVLQLKLHEGFSRTPYKCTADKLTIGYGRNLEDVGLSIKEAEFLLKNDIQAAYEAANKLPWFPNLSEPRQAVVIDMIFNLGVEGFTKFKKTVSHLERGAPHLAAKEMLKSKWATQVGTRAVRLAKQMKEGTWQL